MRPVPLHREKHPLLNSPNCFGCKAASIRIATVPGGSKDERSGLNRVREWDQSLHRYRDKVQAGENPDGTSKAALDKYDQKVALWERKQREIADHNPPEVVKQTKRALLNQE